MVSALEKDPARAAKLVSDLLALRRIVMAEACALVCERPEREWAELRDIANAMADSLDDRIAFARYDQAFTRAMMRISGNVAFELTWNTVVSLSEGRPELLDVLYADRERLLLGVRALLTLLAMRDVNRTRELVRTALEGHDQAMISEALKKRKA
jgi:DNA-binding FadR family transcriptional regulator